MIGSSSDIVFWNVCARDTPITFQLPRAIRAVGKPIGYSSLRTCLARSHRDSGLLAVGHDLLKTQLTVAENSHKRNEHDHLGLPKTAGRTVDCLLPDLRQQRETPCVRLRIAEAILCSILLAFRPTRPFGWASHTRV
jgi:hypothetical protein